MTNVCNVSIIIVNYNTSNLLKNCIYSIISNTYDITYEIIVSDNGSTDDSSSMIHSLFPEVFFIENHANLGFGAANNRALAQAHGKYIFYLNSDTILKNNAVKIFFDYWEHSQDCKKIGALGCNLTDDSGNIVHSYGLFPTAKHENKKVFLDFCRLTKLSIPFIRKIHFFGQKSDLERHKIIPIIGSVEFITGADLFVHNDEHAFFDESFPLYYEDVDLCRRLSDFGKDLLLIDGPQIIHFGGKSNNTTDPLKFYSSYSKANILGSSHRYMTKHHFTSASRTIHALFLLLIICNPYIKKSAKRIILSGIKEKYK